MCMHMSVRMSICMSINMCIHTSIHIAIVQRDEAMPGGFCRSRNMLAEPPPPLRHFKEVCAHAWVRAYMRVCTHACMGACIHAWVRGCVHAWVRVCACL